MAVQHKCFNCGKQAVSRITRDFIAEGNKKSVVIFCCSDECKEQIDDFVEYNNKNYRSFIWVGSFCLLLLLASYILCRINPSFLGMVYVAIILFGVTFLRYPFATWKVYRLMGLKRLQQVIRIVAVIVIALGLYGIFRTYML
ncbi:MAG: hypothetical protein Q4B48_06640 [Syntrophomonadaceae bacterium]|nr:hypothetical protein [Syntrophomonadaceae bacterium]